MAKHFAVRLKKSGIGRPEQQKRTLKGLGLRRFGKTVYLDDTPAIRGMLYQVVHLVEITPKEGSVPATSSRARARAQQAQ